ncbi:hypothetical protein [Vulcanococcus sp.]|uniref:hypothetical protein n=1 Tax=Vulcanococcus sp. TaxID=2856995 RepID=UPI0025DB1C66|nr:hypothetical protein [Vulcanococcus sp.]
MPAGLDSRLDQVEKAAVFIAESMTLARGLCAAVGRAIGISLIMFGLVVMPATELILVLNLNAWHAGDRLQEC